MKRPKVLRNLCAPMRLFGSIKYFIRLQIDPSFMITIEHVNSFALSKEIAIETEALRRVSLHRV